MAAMEVMAWLRRMRQQLSSKQQQQPRGRRCMWNEDARAQAQGCHSVTCSCAARVPPVLTVSHLSPSACFAQRKRVIKDRWVEAMYDRDALIKMQFGK